MKKLILAFFFISTAFYYTWLINRYLNYTSFRTRAISSSSQCDRDRDGRFTKKDVASINRCVFSGLSYCAIVDVNGDGIGDARDISAGVLCMKDINAFPTCRNIDFNKNGQIDESDLNKIPPCIFSGCLMFDPNGDGVIDASDISKCTFDWVGPPDNGLSPTIIIEPTARLTKVPTNIPTALPTTVPTDKPHEPNSGNSSKDSKPTNAQSNQPGDQLPTILPDNKPQSPILTITISPTVAVMPEFHARKFSCSSCASKIDFCEVKQGVQSIIDCIVDPNVSRCKSVDTIGYLFQDHNKDSKIDVGDISAYYYCAECRGCMVGSTNFSTRPGSEFNTITGFIMSVVQSFFQLFLN